MKILIVDDHPLVREGLRDHLLQFEHGVTVLEAGDCADALALVEANPELDLVLLDLKLPDAHGFSALTTLREQHPELPVVVLSAETDRKTVLEALDRGAMGFIPKTSTSQVMLNALRLVLSGGVYLPTEVINGTTQSAEKLASSWGHNQQVRKSITPQELGLTPRQSQVLAMLVQGKTNKHIARELDLAESTVKLHITAVLRALNVANRVQAVIAVGRLGIQLDSDKSTSEE